MALLTNELLQQLVGFFTGGSAGGLPTSPAIDGTVPSGSPYSGAASGTFATIDTRGAGYVLLYVSAYNGGGLVANTVVGGVATTVDAYFMPSVRSPANPIQGGGSLAGVGLFIIPNPGATLTLSNGSTPSAANVVAVVLKSGNWTPPSTWVQGGTLVANSATATSDTSGTLAAATNLQIYAVNAARQVLVISNTGANPMMVRFGNAATATLGHPIAAGATATFDSKVSTGTVNLFSTAGTTYFATTG